MTDNLRIWSMALKMMMYQRVDRLYIGMTRTRIITIHALSKKVNCHAINLRV